MQYNKGTRAEVLTRRRREGRDRDSGLCEHPLVYLRENEEEEEEEGKKWEQAE